MATTSQSPEGRASKTNSPAGSVLWRQGWTGSSAAGATGLATVPGRAGSFRSGSAGTSGRGTRDLGHRGLGDEGAVRPPGLGTFPVDPGLVGRQCATHPRHRRLVLGAGVARAVTNPLELGDQGGRGRVERHLHAPHRSPGPERRLLLDDQASPQEPGGPEAPERLGYLRAGILPHPPGGRRRQDDDPQSQQDRAGHPRHAVRRRAHAGRLFHRRWTQNHCSGWARTCRSIASVKRAVFTTIS